MYNIVAHIYNDKDSYRRLVLSWRRVLLSPIFVPLSLFFANDECHFCMEEIVTYLSGKIVQVDKDKFVVEKYPEDLRRRNIWRNISRGETLKYGRIGFFPDYKKTPEYTWCSEEEGDYVVWLPVSTFDFSKTEYTLKEFLTLTKQEEDDYLEQESIKYTGC